MIFKQSRQVSRETVDKSTVTDNVIFKNLVIELISNLSLNHLKCIFELNKIDPTTEQHRAILKGGDDPNRLKGLLYDLRAKHTVMYEAEIMSKPPKDE